MIRFLRMLWGMGFSSDAKRLRSCLDNCYPECVEPDNLYCCKRFGPT